MRRVRAVLGVLVLLAVPLVGVAISATLIGLGVFLFGVTTGADGSSNGSARGLVFLVILGVITLVVTFIGLARALRSKPVTDGMPLPRERAPELWSIVDFLAVRIGVPVPAEIRLIPDVNAAVAEQTRWLGLRRGHRVLLVGQPLLAGLTVGSLAAVIAHELGHLTNGDTSWGAFAKRGTSAIAHIRDSFRPGSIQHSLYGALLRLFFRISQSEQRRLEFGADRAAAAVTGPAALADALRRSPGIDGAWRGFLDRVGEATGATGALPPDLGAGFVAYLAEPAVQRFMAEVADRPEDRTDPLDSHPSTVQRVAALHGLPTTDVRSDHRSALVLLDPNLVAELYRSVVVTPRPDRPVLDWPGLITRGDAELDMDAARSVFGAAERLTGEPGATPRTLVAMVDRGHAAHLAGALSGAGGPIDVSPGSHGAGLLVAALHSVARAVAAAAGGYRYVLHWPGPKVVAPDGSPLPVRTDPADLYAVGLLRSLPQDFVPPPAAPRPTVSRGLPTRMLPWMLVRPARAVDLLGYDDCLVLVRRRRAGRVRAGAQFGLASKRLDEHLARISEMTAAEHAAAGARVIPLDAIAAVRMTGELRQVTYVLLRDAKKVKLSRDRVGGVSRDMVAGFFTGLLAGRPATVQA